MSKSLKDKIEAINRVRAKAEEGLKRIRDEENKLIAPIKARYSKIVADEVDEFLHGDLMRVEILKDGKDIFRDAVRSLLKSLASKVVIEAKSECLKEGEDTGIPFDELSDEELLDIDSGK